MPEAEGVSTWIQEGAGAESEMREGGAVAAAAMAAAVVGGGGWEKGGTEGRRSMYLASIMTFTPNAEPASRWHHCLVVRFVLR